MFPMATTGVPPCSIPIVRIGYPLSFPSPAPSHLFSPGKDRLSPTLPFSLPWPGQGCSLLSPPSPWPGQGYPSFSSSPSHPPSDRTRTLAQKNFFVSRIKELLFCPSDQHSTWRLYHKGYQNLPSRFWRRQQEICDWEIKVAAPQKSQIQFPISFGVK